MKTILIFLTTAILIGTGLQGFAQTYQKYAVGELEKMLSIDPVNLQKVQILDELAWKLRNRKPEQALSYAKEALALSREMGDLRMEAAALNHFGIHYKNKGEFFIALAYYEESLVIRQNLNDPELTAATRNNIGTLYRKQGKCDIALEYYLPAKKDLDSLNTLGILTPEGKRDLARLMGNIASCYKYSNKYAEAFKLYLAAVDSWKEIGDPKGIAEAYNNLGAFYEYRELFEEAHTYYRTALEITKSIGDVRESARIYLQLGNLFFEHQFSDSALTMFEESRSLQLDLESHLEAAKALRNIGLVHSEKGNQTKAISTFQEVRLVFDSLDAQQDLALILNDLGNSYWEMRELPKAIDHFQSGIAITDSLGLFEFQKTLLSNLAGAYASSNFYQNAYQAAEQRADMERIIQPQNERLRQAESYFFHSRDARKRKQLEAHILRQDFNLKEVEASRLKTLVFALTIGIVALAIFFILVVKIFVTRKKAQLAQKDVEISRNRIDELIKEQHILSLDALLEGQHEERQRLAADLHDKVGGTISAILMYFKELEKSLSSGIQNRLSQGIRLLQDASEDVRRISHDLASRKLELFGLKKVLKDLVGTVGQTQPVNLEFESHGLEERFPFKFENDAYCIVQELLSNALKYSKARDIMVQVLRNQATLNIMVEDNGIGFDHKKIEKKPGIGLQNIRRRVAKYRGEYWIDSTPGKGTTFCVNIPLESNVNQ